MDRMVFLHSGASLHGHEYSKRPQAATVASSPQAAANLRSPLLRSALTPAKTRASPTVDAPPGYTLRQRPASDFIPRKTLTPEPIVRFQEVDEEDKPIHVMQEDHLPSESELSEATAFSVDGAASRPGRGRVTRRRRHAPHQSTKYFLGYPAPKRLPKTKVMQKVFSRLLLQLQVVSEDGRSRPVLELFPSTRIAGPVIAPRLAKRFPGIFGVKRHLSYDDIVLVRRNDDDAAAESEPDSDDSLEKKLLLAVYSPVRHSDEAEIVLEDGSIWVARPLPNGSYDFVHTDEHGIPKTVRWARRSIQTTCATIVPPETAGLPPPPLRNPQVRYTFSIINPMTRRHPVMATLTPSTLDVQDTYTSVSPSYGRYPPHRTAGRTFSMTSSTSWADAVPESPSKRSSIGSMEGDSENGRIPLPSEVEPPRTVRPVDDSTKLLIAVTGMWVALRSGWSANITPTNSDPASTASCSTTRSRRNTWTRTTSEVNGRSTPQPSEPEELKGEPKRHSMPLTAAEKQQASVAVPPPSRIPSPTTPSNTASRRPTSTGAAFMQRRMQKAGLGEQDAAKRKTTKRPRRATECSCSSTELPSEVTMHGGVDGTPKSPTRQRGIGGSKEGVAKKGLRSRLFKWMHKLGGR